MGKVRWPGEHARGAGGVSGDGDEDVDGAETGAERRRRQGRRRRRGQRQRQGQSGENVDKLSYASPGKGGALAIYCLAGMLCVCALSHVPVAAPLALDKRDIDNDPGSLSKPF